MGRVIVQAVSLVRVLVAVVNVIAALSVPVPVMSEVATAAKVVVEQLLVTVVAAATAKVGSFKVIFLPTAISTEDLKAKVVALAVLTTGYEMWRVAS